jgi:O-antigen ligase
MNSTRAHQLPVRILVVIVAVILVVLPFHAFLTVWGSSLAGHYTLLRLWKEVLVAVAVVTVAYLFFKDKKLRQQASSNHLWRLILLYVSVTLIWGVVSYLRGSVTEKAVLYGVLVNTRFLVMFLVAWTAASRTAWLRRNWQKLLVYPGMIAVGFGLLQRFLLPYDFLKHFGYGANTIAPYETIDHKVSYLRVASTLRGANLFGAYLVILISYVAAVSHWLRRRWLVAAAFLACAAGLYASGSRGAWLGALAALVTVAGLRLGRRRLFRREVLAAALVVVILVAGGLFALRNVDFVQNNFFHTDEHSQSAISSNAAHVRSSWAATKQVFRWHEALGRGPGTAGPASYYNTGHSVRIAENYFLQIGQETGWLGLGLFIAIYAGVARLLWRQHKTTLGQTLLASLAGLTVMALLMHIWTDDTISYVWWGLAGVALAPTAVKSREKSVRTDTKATS